jgi:hypothetical protein
LLAEKLCAADAARPTPPALERAEPGFSA